MGEDCRTTTRSSSQCFHGSQHGRRPAFHAEFFENVNRVLFHCGDTETHGRVSFTDGVLPNTAAQRFLRVRVVVP
jgi:hypothetical protein